MSVALFIMTLLLGIFIGVVVFVTIGIRLENRANAHLQERLQIRDLAYDYMKDFGGTLEEAEKKILSHYVK